MAPAQGVTVRRRRLRAELRRLREATGMRQERVAEAMDWSVSKLIRIEAGQVGISTNDLKVLLDLYEVRDPEQVRSLIEMAKRSKQRGWWTKYKESLPTQYTDLIVFETEASTLRCFEPLMIHGLVQTEAYSRAMIREAGLRELSAEEIDTRMTVRSYRRQVLAEDAPPRFQLVLGEAALRQVVGGRQTMRDQLRRLLEVAEQPRVSLQILPFSAGAYPVMTGPFWILEFPEHIDTDIVYLESAAGDLWLEEEAEIERYRLVFEHLRVMALSPDESVALIAKVAEEIP